MNELIVRSNELFGEVRFIELEGKPYAVANDIAKALGYKNPTDAVKTKCVNIVKYEVENLRGQMRMTNIIPEGDIYRLIIGSKLPQAEKFERWVFDEVLPQIRTTGGYIPVKEEDDELTIMSKALLIAQKTLEQKDCLIEEQKKTIKMKAIDKPYTIDKVRGLFGMSRKEFETELYNRGWLKWTEDKQIQILESKYLMKSNKGKKGRPGIYLTEEGLEQITKGRIMK